MSEDFKIHHTDSKWRRCRKQGQFLTLGLVPTIDSLSNRLLAKGMCNEWSQDCKGDEHAGKTQWPDNRDILGQSATGMDFREVAISGEHENSSKYHADR